MLGFGFEFVVVVATAVAAVETVVVAAGTVATEAAVAEAAAAAEVVVVAAEAAAAARILLKNSTIWLSGADLAGFLRNAIRSRQTEESALRKCIELHACEFIATGSIGVSSSAVTTIGFC